MDKNSVNRRSFLRISATAGAGALLIPGAAASGLNKAVETQKTTFPTRTLGRTGIELPVLSMGVMRADNPNVVRAAYNAGITHFDTAHGYQNGRNEEMLGNFFQDKPRDSFYIATKGKFEYPLRDTFEADYTALLDLSLSRLKMDYVDWFYTHALDSVEQITDERVIAQLKKFKAEGKIRHLGISTHALKPELIDAAVDAGVYDVVLLSYNFKLNNLKETDEAIARGVKAGVGFVAMKSMTGAREDAEGKKKVNSTACLKWVWQNENIATTIPGFSSFDELDECLAAVSDLKLTPDENEYLANLRNQEMLFCQRCGECEKQCKEHLPIPELMRAYMYAYGYRQSSLSHETMAELSLPQEMCKSCTNCSVKCTSGFDVARKIAAIAPVRNVPVELLT
ncbi:putative aldo-keto reductase [Bacteroidales bacterium Barb7]|nr:putative aldo-keto reductase [Bacteroidales bacterium Barb7]